ncbi:MAG: hydroxymethylbilane synthase [Alphaproteobacteria bacterium]|nr:hydroxymethylbilane synthase [Alphaproteobacteria bacterium]
MTRPLLRIGTRGSPLALVQARQVRDALAAAHPALAAPQAVEIAVVRTTGDRVQDRKLAEIGGKGLFTKEIEEQLLAGTVDIGVHSSKDMPTMLPEGLMLAAFLPRADARDALIAPAGARGIVELPQGATVATVALRRQALLLHRRPDLKIEPIRGNVDTRLRKLEDGAADALILARAGLDRLARGDLGVAIPVNEMLPAVGQGAVCIECRKDDTRIRDLLAAVDDRPTSLCVRAEMAMLGVLDGSCRTPIAGHALLEHDVLWLRALVARPDGSAVIATERRGVARDGERLGVDAGEELRRRAGPGFFE